MWRMTDRLLRGFLLGVLFLSLLAACQPAAAPIISIEIAMGEPTPGTTAGAMYMIIKNSGNAADRLLSGKSPACGSIEVHKMAVKADGSLGMDLIDKPLEIPANGQVEFMSGGTHIMCILMNEQFKPGARVDLTLAFEKSGEKTTTVLIRK
jgi:periplasmic copper chaperone A